MDDRQQFTGVLIGTFISAVLWFVIIVVACYFLGVFDKQPSELRPGPQGPHIASPREKKLMKYHGTDGATCIGDTCWFYRDGQRINL